MRSHDQTDIRRRRRGRARFGVALAALGAIVLATRGVAAVGEAEAPLASWKGEQAAPIRLRADHVQTWIDEGVNWVYLEDQAEIVQGDVSLRADKAVARIEHAGRADGTLYRVELYAEGNVRDPGSPGASHPEVRTRLVSLDKILLDTRTPGGRDDLKKPPRGYPILARAFPLKPAGTVSAPDPASIPAPAPLAETSASGPAAVDPRPALLAAAFESAPTDAGPGPEPFGSPGPAAPERVDGQVRQAQAVGGGRPQGFADDFSSRPVLDQDLPPDQDPAPGPDPAPGGPLPPLAPNAVPLGPGSDIPVDEPPSTLLPLPDGSPRRPRDVVTPDRDPKESPNAVALPGSQRVTTIFPRGLGEKIEAETLPMQPDGTVILIIRNGVNIQTRSKEQGIVDIEADNAVIFLKGGGREGEDRIDINGNLVTKESEPIEFYLEGHVVVRQDQLIYQGRADQKTYEADRIYYDVVKDRLLALNAQIELFAPGLVTPSKIRSPRIFQYHPETVGPDGRARSSTLPAIQAEQTVTTGSRFANPGYRFNSRSIDIRQVVDDRELAKGNAEQPFGADDLTWRIDARGNTFFFGPAPVFYWPRLNVEADDLNPPIQGISFATNNYFGQQFRTDWDIFNLFGLRHAPEIDAWNLDVDYLSARDKAPGQGIALGSEIGYYGQDLINDILDPFHKDKGAKPSFLKSYAGYFDVYGLFDGSRDVLGPGLAVITNGPNNNAAGRANFSRFSNPTYQLFRGRANGRHMQSLLAPDAPLDEDFRAEVELGLTSDRNFLEQYFKRLFDTGLDIENVGYLIRQKQNTAATLIGQVNLQRFYTQTQWYPKGDYYRLGDSILNNHLTYYQHTGADYANVHTAAEVNNRTLFAFLPTDPITNTAGTFQSGRLYTAHELDAPINLGFARVTPYVQGQAVGWNNQIQGHAVGRLWGAFGSRADVMLWKVYPDAESELFNVHGLNHKIDFVADYRNAYSNVPLNSIGVQDQLDDNTYEYTRRYFALTNYAGAILPAQYDPRFLILRRALSPITGTTDIQASIETLKLGIHQRLQTKRGPEGRRHITDYMVFDVDTTYFPQASRDNFGKPFGQNFYNYEWYLGDRTSFVSYGWFEFFKVAGNPFVTSQNTKNDPFGLRIITSGFSITRIPKGNIFIGYTVVNTGPINSSALNATYSYWLSPKWFGTAASSYDFGNARLLGASGSLTRIGADYLTSVGLAVSPLQHSYQFVFEISPRLTPNLRLGSASGLARLNSAFMPVE